MMAVLAGLVLSATAGGANEAPARPAVTVQIVKYDGLMQEVRRHRGQVVVIDIWGLT